MSNYIERTECLFCKCKNLIPLWNKSYEIALGCYAIEDSTQETYTMPFNILKCCDCLTYQTQYLGNPDIIYNYEARFHGSIRSTMNKLFSEFILENKSIQHILEIGAGNGSISEYILEKNNIQYTIVDPTYSGSKENRTIHNCFIEDFKDPILADTIVMSHVFEHFYDPIKIMEDLFQKNNSIQQVYLNFPDLENYILEGNYHVLNPEHIFYAEHNFIIDLFKKYGFNIHRIYSHEHHSIFFEFIRSKDKIDTLKLVNKHSQHDVPLYFNTIFKRIDYFHSIINQYPSHKVYIWPCSMHTTYLFALGFDQTRITAILDNAPHKIGKYLYGTKLKCLSMQEFINNTKEDCIIILNGGCYNKEVANTIQKENIFILT